MGTLISTVLFAAFSAGAYLANDSKDAKEGEMSSSNKMLLGAALCFTLGYLARGNRS